MSRILVIEDGTDLAYGLQNNLEIEGHRVRVAETGGRVSTWPAPGRRTW